MKLVNVMEEVVIEYINRDIDILNCCTCEQCKTDIAAYVLNHVPPKYVATSAGELYSKLNIMNSSIETEIMVEMAKAAEIVREHPRHQES
jgi:competence protein ComFB